MLIHGTYHFRKKRVACRNAYCTVCEATRFAEAYRSLLVLHVCFIPLLPIGVTTRWLCGNCQLEVDSRIPSRPAVLGLGIAAAVLFIGIGLMIAFATGEYVGGGIIVGIGLLMVTAFSWLLKRREYRSYLKARKSVVPLDRGVCPYCQAPLAPRAVPRCHACRVNVVVE